MEKFVVGVCGVWVGRCGACLWCVFVVGGLVGVVRVCGGWVGRCGACLW